MIYGDGLDSPRSDPAAIAALLGVVEPIDLQLGFTVERTLWLDDPNLRGRTFMAGYALSRAVNDGRLVPLPVRLSAVPSVIMSNPFDIAVVVGVPRGDGYAFGATVGWADVAAATAGRVVVEVDQNGFDFGAPMIAGNIVATVPRPDSAQAPTAQRSADDIDLRIGQLVVSLLPDDATLQFGPGGIGEGIANALDRPVKIWSGLLTDAMARLADRGLLIGKATAAYTWGGEPVFELARKGLVDMRPVTYTHDITRVSSIPRFVGCNTALQIGLDGAVNVERVGGRIITSVGGHADFCLGASRSVGGLSVIAVRSCTARGESTIVPVAEAVSTPRSDVQVVVTEHGIADLRGIDDRERAARLIRIAAPQHRAMLEGASS